MKPKILVVVAGVIAGSAAAVVTGWAFWTGSGGGAGAAAVGAGLSAPTTVTATVPSASVRTVHVTWTAATTPDGSTPSGFTVARNNGTTTSAACGTGTAALPGTSTSCDDTNVPSATYTYTVTVQWNSWTATSAPSSSVTMAASTLHHLTVVPSTSTPTAGTQFSVTVSATDQYGAVLSTYTGNQCVTFSGP